MEVKIDDICIDESIYPRECISEKTIDSYVEALKTGTTFPAIEIQKIKDEEGEKNTLLDGRHRYEAYKKYNEEKDVIPIEEIECLFWRDSTLNKDEWLEDLRIESVKRNIKHGIRLKEKDIQFQALRIVEDRPIEMLTGIIKKLAEDFNVTESWISKLIGPAVASRKASRDAIIYRLSLLGWTQREIGNVLGLVHSTVNDVVGKFPTQLFDQEYQSGMTPEEIASSHNLDEPLVWSIILKDKDDIERFNLFGRNDKEKIPQIYNIWNFVDRDPRLGVKYAGNIPGQIAMNVLYHYTKQGDLVVDPMAGGGSTIDACLIMGRRCRAYDVNPLEARKDIEPWDITSGFPERAKNCDLIFFDPPYFKKKAEEYGDNSVSALDRDSFLGFVEKLASDSYQTVKKDGIVSIIISDYLDYTNREEPILSPEYYIRFKDVGFTPINHISCPLSTQQWNGIDVKRSKKDRILLETARDLFIFKKKK